MVLYDHTSAHPDRGPRPCVRYCVVHIERELGDPECWLVKLPPKGSGFHGAVSVEDGLFAFQSASSGLTESGLTDGAESGLTTSGLDDALAAWDALCSLEQALREARARRTPGHPAERFDHG